MLRKIAYIIAGLAAAFLMAQTLYFKFSGSAESIYIFKTVGMEPWGRWLIGTLEFIAAVFLLIPNTVWAGGVLAVGLMMGAIGMHLTILGIEIIIFQFHKDFLNYLNIPSQSKSIILNQ